MLSLEASVLRKASLTCGGLSCYQARVVPPWNSSCTPVLPCWRMYCPGQAPGRGDLYHGPRSAALPACSVQRLVLGSPHEI